jgi:hypothetical protein
MSEGRWGLGGCALTAALGMCVLGLVTHQSFQSYLLVAKSSEARSQLSALRTGITVYAMQEVFEPGGTARLRGLPPSLPRTPGAPSADLQHWPSSADPIWDELGLDTADGVYYAYENVSDPRTNVVVVRAVGDLDGDGVLSDWSLRGVLDPSTGEITCDAIASTDELE